MSILKNVHPTLKKYRKRSVWVLLLAILGTACNDCEPVTPPGNELVVSFFSLEEIRSESPRFIPKVPAVEQIYDPSLGDPLDLDIVVEDTLRKYRFLLPLPFDSLSTSFVFETEFIDETDPDNPDTLQRMDTLGISYARKMVVISPDCGFYEELTDVQITQSTFDSSAVFINSLQANDTTNLLIFF